MLDKDLAQIYGYSTKDFKRQVKNNIEKFDGNDFMFQLTREELDNLVRCNFCTSRNNSYFKGQNGGTRYLPFVFTEQGVYMLMTVLKGDLATKQSKALIRLFKSMKDIIYENSSLLPYKNLELRTSRLEGDVNDLKADIDKVMDNFVDPSTYKHFLIMNGKKIEADSAYIKLFKTARKSILYIDNYVGIKTLELLSNARTNVSITIFTDCNTIKEYMIDDFKIQNPNIKISFKKTNNKYHDRYIIVDYGTKNKSIYHCGASCKDAGNKVCSINKIEAIKLYKPMINSLKKMQELKLS